MNDDRRLERLYEGLTPKETATLVYSHLSRGNDAEADRIRDLVPLKVYRLPDPEHTDHFERLRRATLYYGMERWRYQAHCFAASGIVVHFYQSENEQDQERSQQCKLRLRLRSTPANRYPFRQLDERRSSTQLSINVTKLGTLFGNLPN